MTNPSTSAESEKITPIEAIRPAVQNLPASLIREVAHLGMNRSDIIPLWFGEPDVPTPEFIRTAAIEALAQGDTFYQPNRGIPQLRSALAAYLSRLYARSFEPGHVTVTVSGLNAVMIALQSLLEPDDTVVTTTPLWPNLTAMPQILSANMRCIPLQATTTGWQLDLDRLFDACDEGTRVILINSPNNPTGWLMTAAEQQTVLDFARKRGIWVLSDEVYARIVYDSPVAPSFLSLMEEYDRLIVVNSFSKSWAMTGWRLGWLTAPTALGPVFEKLMEFNVSCPSGFVQQGGIRALEQGEDFVHGAVDRYGRSRAILLQRLKELPRVSLPTPQAAFYGFFTVDGIPDTLAFAKRLLTDTGVGLAPGEAFGTAGKGYLRLCFAVSAERLNAALDRMEPLLR